MKGKHLQKYIDSLPLKSRIRIWFYNTTLYYKFRHYFIRKKSPLSWIFWGEILRRESSSIGNLNREFIAIELDRGQPKETGIVLSSYDVNNNYIGSVFVKLPYRTIPRLEEAFLKAEKMGVKGKDK